MKNLKTEPMVKHSNQVHTTTDYFLFKSIEGNRNKNLLHINRLKKSMSENYLFTVIIVNDKPRLKTEMTKEEIMSSEKAKWKKKLLKRN